MALDKVTIKDAAGTNRDIRCFKNADDSFSQITSEGYSSWRVTKVTIGTSAVSLSSLLPSAAALTDRKKLLIYPSPSNTGTIHYNDVTIGAGAVADYPPLPAALPKELWLLQATDVHLKASAAGQVAWVEEFA